MAAAALPGVERLALEARPPLRADAAPVRGHVELRERRRLGNPERVAERRHGAAAEQIAAQVQLHQRRRARREPRRELVHGREPQTAVRDRDGAQGVRLREQAHERHGVAVADGPVEAQDRRAAARALQSQERARERGDVGPPPPAVVRGRQVPEHLDDLLPPAPLEQGRRPAAGRQREPRERRRERVRALPRIRLRVEVERALLRC